MMNDEELFESLRLGPADEVDVWPHVAKGLPRQTTVWEYLLPLSAAAAAVFIASMMAHGHAGQRPSNWPVKETVLVQVAEIRPADYSKSYR